MFLSLLTTVLLIMPRTLFTLAAASVHCLDGLALSCIITPKSFSSSVCLILLLSISNSNLQFLLPTCMTAHLSMLNGMFQSFDHLCSLSKSPLRALASSSLFTRGATKGGLEGAQAPPSLKSVCPVIRPDPMTFFY